MHSTILSGGGGGFKRDERELSLNACVTKVRNTSDIRQNKFSYFYMLSHQECLAFSLRGSRGKKTDWKLHISIHKIQELGVSSQPALYILWLWEETQAWRECTASTLGGGVLSEDLFLSNEEGAGNFWHYVPSRPRMRSEAEHHLFFFLFQW